MPQFVAAFLSHAISQNLLSDPTLDSFYINIANQKNNEKIQAYLHQLINGEHIEITEKEIQDFISQLNETSKDSDISDFPPTNITALLLLNHELQNDEISEEIYQLLISALISNDKKNDKQEQNHTKEEITHKIIQIQKIETILNLIKKQEKGRSNKSTFSEHMIQYIEKEYKEIIDEIASQFDEIDEKYFYEMNENFLDSILSSEKLKINNEDSLLSVLLNRRAYILSNKSDEIDQHHFYIEKVEFEYLSEEGIRKFLDEVEFDQISFDVWSQIKKRLLLPVQIKMIQNERHKSLPGTEFKYNEASPFCGIFDHLTKKTNGNIQNNSTIEIKSSNLSCGKYQEIVDFQNPSAHTHVGGNPNPRWLQIDFKARKIQIDSYLIKSAHTDEDSDNKYYLRSWKVEISSDGSRWDCVDERTNVSELNGNYKMQFFKLKKITDPFRFIRIITNQGNWYNDNGGFSIGKLEFYGNIIET